MSSDTSRFLEEARGNLRKVDTVDATKEHSYLGRIVPQADSKSHIKKPLVRYGKPERSLETYAVREEPIPNKETGNLIPVFDDELVSDSIKMSSRDLKRQIEMINRDMEMLSNKLKLSEDRIRGHRSRYEENMLIQKDAGIKASELRGLVEETSQKKFDFLEQEHEQELKRAEAHRSAVEMEAKRARSKASEMASLEVQRLARERAKNHEKGIRFAEALREKYRIQMKILQAQKEAIEFESNNKEILSYTPILYHKESEFRFEVPMEELEEKRLYRESEVNKGVVTGRLEEEMMGMDISEGKDTAQDDAFQLNWIP